MVPGLRAFLIFIMFLGHYAKVYGDSKQSQIPDFSRQSSEACQATRPQITAEDLKTKADCGPRSFQSQYSREPRPLAVIEDLYVIQAELEKRMVKFLANRAIENGIKQNSLSERLGIKTDFYRKLRQVPQCEKLSRSGINIQDIAGKSQLGDSGLNSSNKGFQIDRTLFKKRLALSTLHSAVIKGSLGLARPTVSSQDQVTLDRMKLMYPETHLPEAFEVGQKLLARYSNQNPKTGESVLATSGLDQNSFGLSSTALRALSFSDERDKGGFDSAVESYLYPSEGSRNWMSKGGVNPFSNTNGPLNKMASRLITEPLSPEIEKDLDGLIRKNVEGSTEALAKLCEASFCDLLRVNSAASSAIIESLSTSQLRSKARKLVCNTCAKDDVSSSAKFWAHYGGMFEIAADVTAVGTCIFAPPWGCIPLVALGAKSTYKQGQEWLHALHEMQAYESYLSATLLASEYDMTTYNRATVKAWEAGIMTVLFATTTAIGGKEAVEAFHEAKELSHTLALLQKHANAGAEGASTFKAIHPKHLRDPGFRQTLRELGDMVEDQPEALALTLERFLTRESARLVRFANPAEFARAASLPQRIDILKASHAIGHGDEEAHHFLYLNPATRGFMLKQMDGRFR